MIKSHIIKSDEEGNLQIPDEILKQLGLNTGDDIPIKIIEDDNEQ